MSTEYSVHELKSGDFDGIDRQKVSRCLDDLWQIDEWERKDYFDYLQKIFRDLLENPDDLKLQSFSIFHICKRFRGAPAAINLLFLAGFEEGADSESIILRWKHDTNSMNRLKFVNEALHTDTIKVCEKWVCTKNIDANQKWAVYYMIILESGKMKLCDDKRGKSPKISFDLCSKMKNEVVQNEAMCSIKMQSKGRVIQLLFESANDSNEVMECIKRFVVEHDVKNGTYCTSAPRVCTLYF